MRTDTHRLAGTLVALGFVAGWFSASWVSPPTAVTQVRPARPVAATPEVPMPRIALGEVTAPGTTPAGARNPFVFSDGRPSARAVLSPAPGIEADTAGDVATTTPAPAPAPADSVPDAPVWRVVGIAADAEDRLTAVVSGGGGVFLLGLGDRLPDGSSVLEIDAAGLVLSTPAGEHITLRLP